MGADILSVLLVVVSLLGMLTPTGKPSGEVERLAEMRVLGTAEPSLQLYMDVRRLSVGERDTLRMMSELVQMFGKEEKEAEVQAGAKLMRMVLGAEPQYLQARLCGDPQNSDEAVFCLALQTARPLDASVVMNMLAECTFETLDATHARLVVEDEPLLVVLTAGGRVLLFGCEAQVKAVEAEQTQGVWQSSANEWLAVRVQEPERLATWLDLKQEALGEEFMSLLRGTRVLDVRLGVEDTQPVLEAEFATPELQKKMSGEMKQLLESVREETREYAMLSAELAKVTVTEADRRLRVSASPSALGALVAHFSRQKK